MRRAGNGAGALALCAGGSACTVPVRSFRTRFERADVEIPLERFPELEREGGIIKVEDRSLGRAVFVRREADGGLVGISATCTHQGCHVRPGGSGFRCPCHGSSYDAAGRNIAGPARRPLARVPVRERDGAAVVLLGGKESS